MAISQDGRALLYRTWESSVAEVRVRSLPDLKEVRSFPAAGLPDVFGFFGSRDGRSFVVGENGADGFMLHRVGADGLRRTTSIAY